MADATRAQTDELELVSPEADRFVGAYVSLLRVWRRLDDAGKQDEVTRLVQRIEALSRAYS